MDGDLKLGYRILICEILQAMFMLLTISFTILPVSLSLSPPSPPLRTAGRLWRGSGAYLPSCRSLTDRRASCLRGGSGP